MSGEEKWVTIPDADVRHIWADPDGKDETAIEPTFYGESGTPGCSYDGDHEGEDMEYVRTEIRNPRSNVIVEAAKFAEAAHRGQLRKNTEAPYITHPGRVAARISRFPLADENWVAAAWCHDVLEDCNVTLQELTMRIGPVAAGIVFELTNPSKEFKHLPRAERKKMDREHLSKCSLAAKCIKLADRTDNLSEMAEYSDEFKSMYCEESVALGQAITGSIEDESISDHMVLALELVQVIVLLRSSIKETP